MKGDAWPDVGGEGAPARWGDTITRELGTEDFKRPGLRALNSQWLTGSGSV